MTGLGKHLRRAAWVLACVALPQGAAAQGGDSLTVRLGAMIAAAAAFVVGLLEMLKTVS